jgi:glycosyltransferase involved in cell wall biosynthesis
VAAIKKRADEDLSPGKSILVVSYVFPPIAYAGTYRTMRICRYLESQGYEVKVLTIQVQGDLDNDPALLEKVGEGIEVFRTRTIDPWRAYQRFRNRLLGSATGRIFHKIASRMIHYTNLPDHMVYWVPFAVASGLRIIKENQIPLIYTSSPPHSSQMIGYLLKKLTHTKWIADLRDPIMTNQTADGWGLLERKINHALEKKLMSYSDAVITNSGEVRKDMALRYGKDNVYVVRNSYDEEDFSRIPRRKYPCFTVSHVGSLYGFRKVDVLFEAVHRLASKGVIDPNNFRLQFVGINPADIRDEAETYGVKEYLVFKEMVPHREAVEVMVMSHLLLLVKGFGRNSRGQIPGKLYEYIGSGNPILCIGPKDSEAAEIIRDAKCGYVVDRTPEDIERILLGEFLRFRGKGNATTAPRAEAPEKYSSYRMGREVSEILETVRNGKN